MNNTYELAINSALIAGEEILKIYHSDDFDVSKKSDSSPLTRADKAAHNIIVEHLKSTPYPILSEEGKDIPYEERKNWETFWLVDPLDGTKEFIKRNDEFTVNIALIQNNKPIFGVVYAPVLRDLYYNIPNKGSYLQKLPPSLPSPFGDVAGVRLHTDQAEAGVKRTTPYKIVASRSHMSPETETYINSLKEKHKNIEIVSKGSSLKLCMVASGEADEYPRLGPTMEWDVAAATAIVIGAGKSVTIFGTDQALEFNKVNLLNPYFLVK